MRDIKSSKSNKKPGGLVSKDDFEESDMELYEVNEEIKAQSRQAPKADRAIRKMTTSPKKQKLMNESNRRNVAYKKIATPKTKSPGKKWLGSKVPLTNIHAEPVAPIIQGGAEDDSLLKKNKVEKVRKLKVDDKRKKFRPSGKVKVARGDRMVLMFIFGLVIIAAGVAMVIFLPTAKLEVQLRTAPLLVDEELQISASGESGVVPGTAFWREVMVEEIQTVANRETIGTVSKGTVTLINNTVDEQPIKERSRLEAADGQLFYMIKHAIVPAKSSVSIEVEAAEAGEEGNISVQRLNFVALDEASQRLVYVEASNGISGGSGEEVSVVGESDFEAAKDAAAEVARGQAEVTIREELAEEWTLLDESWTAEIEEFVTEVSVGDKAPSFNFAARVTIRVMGYQQDVLQDKLREELESKLDPDFMLFPGQISYSKTVKDIDWDEARATLVTRVTHTTIPKLSLDTLRAKVAGRSVEETVDYLEGLPGVQMVSIQTWPFWVNSVPRIENRVTLDLQPERQP